MKNSARDVAELVPNGVTKPDQLQRTLNENNKQARKLRKLLLWQCPERPAGYLVKLAESNSYNATNQGRCRPDKAIVRKPRENNGISSAASCGAYGGLRMDARRKLEDLRPGAQPRGPAIHHPRFPSTLQRWKLVERDQRIPATCVTKLERREVEAPEVFRRGESPIRIGGKCRKKQQSYLSAFIGYLRFPRYSLRQKMNATRVS